MNSDVSCFLKESIDLVQDNPTNRIKKSVLYQSYLDYCSIIHKDALTKREFYKDLISAGFSEIKSQQGQELFRGMRFKDRKLYKEEKMPETKSVWEQVDLISAMKQDYEKAVAERDEAKTEAEAYAKQIDEYEKQIEELKDKILITEKENNDLKSEKKELSKMQIETVDFQKEVDKLQVRVGKYNQEINFLLSDMNTLRKDYSALQTKLNQMQDNKKKLDGVLSDLVGCSKRLMNLK